MNNHKHHHQTALSITKRLLPLTKGSSREEMSVRVKEDGSYVTDLDTRLEGMIRKELSTAYPDHDITGEEFGASQGGSRFRWYVDPIDGTLSFKLGLPFYGTIITLCEDDRPVVAVISLPELDRIYHAWLGGGAFCNGEPISIVDVAPEGVADELIGTGDIYAFRLAGAELEYIDLLRKHRLLRTIPDCVGHAFAADGSLGAMVDYYLNRWDYLATELLVREAGGRFEVTGSTELEDGRTAYNIICGKPSVVGWLLREVFRESVD